MTKGSIVVSLRSKGLPSFNKGLFFDLRYQAVQFATEFLDLFIALLVSFSCLSWSSWISVAVTVVCIAAVVESNFAEAPFDLVFPFFMYIILPLLILLTFVFSRRERASRHIGDMKATLVTLLVSRPPGGTPQQRDASDDIHRKAVGFLEDLHKYLQHQRPYARHFYLPYRTSDPSPGDDLLRVSRELGLLLRRVHRGVRDMHLACNRLRASGASDFEVSCLVRLVQQLHTSTEQLIAIKEQRTPVVIRATIRWFVVILMPVTMSPYWHYLGRYMGNPALAGILGVLTQVALMSVVDTVVALEDPFDDSALDAISLFEMLDQVGVMANPAPDGDGYDTEGLGNGNGGDEGGPHLSMVVGGSNHGGGAAGDPESAGLVLRRSAGSAQTSGVASAGSAGMTDTSSLAPGQSSPGQHIVQPNGMPAMRASVATSETAVGPPTARDAHAGPAGGGLPSITSPLPEVAVPVRAPVAMPPMPALAGQPLYRMGPPPGLTG